MSASDVIGSERMEALLRGDAPRTAGEERRAALLDGLRAAQLRAPEALRTRVLAVAPERRPARFRLRRAGSCSSSFPPRPRSRSGRRSCTGSSARGAAGGAAAPSRSRRRRRPTQPAAPRPAPCPRRYGPVIAHGWRR